MFIPTLREDLIFEYIEDNGESLVVYHDKLLIAQQPIAVPKTIHEFISSIQAKTTETEFINKIKINSADIIQSENILKIINTLENLGFMETTLIQSVRNIRTSYLESPIKEPVCSGTTYPDSKIQLNSFLDEILSLSEEKSFQPSNIILSPHIDFRVGENAKSIYSDNYNAIKQEKYDLIILLGTSHYQNSDYLMFTKKHYQTPLGTIKTDINFIEKLEKQSKYPITIDDLAHLNEHSLELNIVFIQKLFGNNTKILPILTGSLHEFIENNIYPDQSERINETISSIQNLIKNKKVLFIASGDFSHFGKRFDDPFDADSHLHRVYNEDNDLINSIINGDRNQFFDQIATNNNHNKVCGFSPFYLTMHLTNAKKGTLHSYSQWNDTDTKSAVSFAGLSLFQ